MSFKKLKSYLHSDLNSKELQSLLARPKMDVETITKQVAPIIERVRKEGDQAVIDFTQQFDGVRSDKITLNPQELTVNLPEDVKDAIDVAYENIRRFHKAQRVVNLEVETMNGVVCERISRPIQRVGLYVPGGTAVLPSTALMLGVPAQIAGCSTIVMATPPNKDGKIADEVIYVAQKTGVTHLLLAGGAQAVAAMAYGTQNVPKVDKLFGPGNQYVTAAKMLLQNSEAMVSIDMPAGPSEVLVIADEEARPAFVAADLLSQAEHGVDSQVVLVAIKGFDIKKLQSELQKQCQKLPRRKMAEGALANSYILEVASSDEAMAFSNEYAPEHLIIQTADAREDAKKVMNAGSVFIGSWTPESVGDYASGTNHTLPTYGYARMYSGVNLSAYQKHITMQELTHRGIRNLGPSVITLAKREGLDAHARAVEIRLKQLGEE